MTVKEAQAKEFKELIVKHTKELSKEKLQALIYDLMNDEMERVLFAVEITKNNYKAGKLLGMSGRTVFRRLAE